MARRSGLDARTCVRPPRRRTHVSHMNRKPVAPWHGVCAAAEGNLPLGGNHLPKQTSPPGAVEPSPVPGHTLGRGCQSAADMRGI